MQVRRQPVDPARPVLPVASFASAAIATRMRALVPTRSTQSATEMTAGGSGTSKWAGVAPCRA
ncbi:MAG: hypothetical protein CMD83_18985 [Gammaproteobacteria bacterium]|nr:hypothetical protein [Gammaproteobacteria bacterium]MBS04827.1 hypothetical protein [Gammaproteobacteria bacterium]